MDRTQLTTTADLTRDEVDFLIKEAEKMRGKWTNDLKDKIVATLFLEPSTRTRLSFETAAQKLGAKVITVADPKTSSIKKGETLADTISVVEKYADIIVMRHPMEGAADEAVKYTKKPFLNAGDGANQHPTQALLDAYTFQNEVGGIDDKVFAFVGDLKFGRTVHSILYVLRLYKPKKVVCISPEQLKMPKEYLNMLDKAGIEYIETKDLNGSMGDIDILYMTRVQQERFEDPADYEALKGSYILTPEIIKMGKPGIRVMHPLPRVDEITVDVDKMEQAAYFREAENGVYMRMALLKNLSKNYYSK
jgi:aspartate carbamoyltransferase catalytic subunit